MFSCFFSLARWSWLRDLPNWGPPETSIHCEIRRLGQRLRDPAPFRFDTSKPPHLLIALHGHGADRCQFVRDARGECLADSRCCCKVSNYLRGSIIERIRQDCPGSGSGSIQIFDDLNLASIVRSLSSAGSMEDIGRRFCTDAPALVDGVISLHGMAKSR